MTKRNVLIVGAGGVAHVAAHKAAMHNDELGDICIARSLAPVAEATGNGRRLARAMASRRVVGRRRHTLAGSLMR